MFAARVVCWALSTEHARVLCPRSLADMYKTNECLNHPYENVVRVISRTEKALKVGHMYDIVVVKYRCCAPLPLLLVLLDLQPLGGSLVSIVASMMTSVAKRGFI